MRALCSFYIRVDFDPEDGGSLQMTRFNIPEDLNLRNFAVRTSNVALVVAVLFSSFNHSPCLVFPFNFFLFAPYLNTLSFYLLTHKAHFTRFSVVNNASCSC